jgi:hypothetical protein
MASSSKSRHPGAAINSSKGKVLSYQTNNMRVPPAQPVAPQGRGPSFNNMMPAAGGMVRGQGSSPPTRRIGTKGIKHFSYQGGLKPPGQFTG